MEPVARSVPRSEDAAVSRGVEKRSDAPVRSPKRAAFEADALDHRDDLYGLALRLTGGDEPRSADLVQEAMLGAYRAWDAFGTGTNCRAWLITALRNAFLNECRRWKSRPIPVEYDDEAAAGEPGPLDSAVMAAIRDGDPEEDFFRKLVGEEMGAAIESPDSKYSLLLVLSDLEGSSYPEEITDLLEIPLSTVKSRLFRARRRLREMLRVRGRDRLSVIRTGSRTARRHIPGDAGEGRTVFIQ